MTLHPTTIAVHGIAAMVAAERGLPLEDIMQPDARDARDQARRDVMKRSVAAGASTDAIMDALGASYAEVIEATRGCVAAIVQQVARETGVSAEAIRGTSRKREVAHARQRVMFLLRQRGWSYPRIGWQLNRDHTTVQHGVRAERERQEVRA